MSTTKHRRRANRARKPKKHPCLAKALSALMKTLVRDDRPPLFFLTLCASLEQKRPRLAAQALDKLEQMGFVITPTPAEKLTDTAHESNLEPNKGITNRLSRKTTHNRSTRKLTAKKGRQ